MPRRRQDWEGLEQEGKCPECRQVTHLPTCRKRWFDTGYRMGYHDGANNLDCHEHAFVIKMLEYGEYDDA
jgi:hypothetical protein